MPLWLMSSHVAPDGIAVDHGRAVATYQVPTGLVLQAGDRIAIGCNGELRLPHAPEQGAGIGRLPSFMFSVKLQ